MTFMFPDGRALDDMEPQDIPRTVAHLLDRVADAVRDGQSEEERAEFEESLRRAAALLRFWAHFGKWPTPTKVPLPPHPEDDDDESEEASHG